MNTRREWMGALLTSIGPGLTAAANREIPVIDAHTHFYDPYRKQGVPWPAKTDALLYRRVLPKDFRAAAKGMNVAGTVVVEASPWLEDNQWILDLAKKDKFIVGFVGNLEIESRDFGKQIDRFAANRIFRGIRLNDGRIRTGLDRPAVVEGLRLLAERGLTLDAIGGNEVLRTAVRVSDAVPELRIVIDHLPFVDQSPLIRELRARPNVFAKVSGILREVDGRVPMDVAFYRDALDEVWETFGADRVVYASNWPVCEKWGSYRQVQTLATSYFEGKGVEAMRRYFFENSRKAYRHNGA